MLEVRGLTAGYGPSQVLFDVDLTVGDGEIVALMGRNGMGKTTTVRSIMGLVTPSSGSLRFGEANLRRLAPDAVARLGIGLVPEGRHVFATLSVFENLVATAANRAGGTAYWTTERVFELFPRLRERSGQSAATLSGGEQQMLVIGRALMTNPSLLIVDEATEGLAPLVRRDIWTTLARLKAQGLAILVIDKNIEILKTLADRVSILQKGRTVWTGSTAELDRQKETVSGLLSL